MYTHVCKYTYISGFLIKYWKNERPLKLTGWLGNVDSVCVAVCWFVLVLVWVRDYAIFFTLARPISHLPFLLNFVFLIYCFAHAYTMWVLYSKFSFITICDISLLNDFLNAFIKTYKFSPLPPHDLSTDSLRVRRDDIGSIALNLRYLGVILTIHRYF